MADTKNTPQETDTLPEAVESGVDGAETPEEADHEEALEDHHTPLSARVLKVLFIMAVGSGIALWGAPKLALMLPAGLSPVAEYLMPGQAESQKEIAALRAEVTEKIAALESRPAGDVTRKDLTTALAASEQKTTAALAGIKDRLAAVDSQKIETRLAKVETRLESITAELAAMNERLALQITDNGAALSKEAASKLSGYQAVIDKLKARIDDVATKNNALSQQVDDVAKGATSRVAKAQADATAKVASTAASKLLADIGSALDSGSSFQGALDGLHDLTGINPPKGLAAVSATGTPSLTKLKSQFGDVAYSALRADTQASSGSGVVGKIGAFLKTQVGTRSLTRQSGNSTDAILSRIEDELSKGNLAQSLAEAETLSEAPKEAMKDWIVSLSRLSAASTALMDLSKSLGAAQ